MSDDNVLPFQKEVPHLTNKAKCLICRHEFQAVAPIGTTWLECPACSMLMARFIGPVNIEGLHWQCKCGNDLFYITEKFSYCPCCGSENVFT